MRFRNLPNGTYTLTVSGSGFATYTQTINAQDLLYSVQLYTGFLAGYTYAADNVHPGALRIGDVDGDGAIRQTDADGLIDALESEDLSADLDGSGTVDLIDLQMLAANLEDTRDTQAAVQTSVPESLMTVEKEENTQLTGGSLEDLVTGAQPVKLQPVSGESISDSNPVTVSFDFEKSAKAPVEMEGLVLQTPPASEAAVSAATVLVEYEENGETKTMEIPVGNGMLARFLGAASVQPDGSIVVDFGGQIAVKKVTIKVTAV
ncbi:dockerin type I domain-containing protein [Subdoligranulum variabile]|uniref:dockerin type I domain-containing protein n=1 Tax=Subdoligranulum variabile TaxID=214851 RepID=UPI0026F12DFC|nr:dockerin type I domain-containing protein [Subdoligranulum variabile]